MEDELEKELLGNRGKGRKKKGQHPNSLAAIARSRKPFQKNNPITGEKDERINRKGAPDTTAAMRKLIQSIGADLLTFTQETNGKKRSRIKSRIVDKIERMYDSDNPADSTAILKAGWPGLLGEDTGDGKPREIVLKIVYENKRALPNEEEIEEGLLLGPGQEEPDGVEPGIYKSRPPQPIASWEPDSSHTNLETPVPVPVPQDKPGYGLREHPDSFYCVLCKEFQTGLAHISIDAGGWICSKHK